MRFATWNVNSIRTRLPRVVDWLDRARPDVVALQETKCDDERFESAAGPIRELGYELAHHGRDHWNGVAIASRVGLDDVRRGFDGVQRPPYDEARLIRARCGGIDIASVYVPNGRTLDDPHYLFKLVWLERLRGEVDPDRPCVIAGDVNVAPADVDVYDPSRWRGKTHASPPERAAIVALVDRGLVDVGRRHAGDAPAFTWWSYRPGQFERDRGLRIDLVLASPDVADRVIDVTVDRDERAPGGPVGPSDHAPVIVDLAQRA